MEPTSHHKIIKMGKASKLLDILDQNGWSTFNAALITADGKKRTAYAIEKYWQNLHRVKPTQLEDVENAIRKAFKNVKIIKTYCQYAPEIKHVWVAVW